MDKIELKIIDEVNDLAKKYQDEENRLVESRPSPCPEEYNDRCIVCRYIHQSLLGLAIELNDKFTNTKH